MDYQKVALRNDPRWKGVDSLKPCRRRFMARPWSNAVRQAWYLRLSKQTHRSSRTASPAYEPPSPVFANIWLDAPLPPQSGSQQDTIDIREPPYSQQTRRTPSSVEERQESVTKTHQLHPRIPSWAITKAQGQGEAVWIPATSSPPAWRPDSSSPATPESPQQLDLNPFASEDKQDIATSPAALGDEQDIAANTAASEEQQGASTGPLALEVQEKAASSPGVSGQQNVNLSLATSENIIHNTHRPAQIPPPFEEPVRETTGAAPSIPSNGELKAKDATKGVTKKPKDSRIKQQRTEEDEGTAIPPRKRKKLVSRDPHVFFLKTDRWQCRDVKKEQPEGKNLRAPGPRLTPGLAGRPGIRVPKRGGQGEPTAPLGPRLAGCDIRERRLAARESRAQAAEDLTRHERVKEGGALVDIVRLPFVPIPRAAWSILPGKILQ